MSSKLLQRVCSFIIGRNFIQRPCSTNIGNVRFPDRGEIAVNPYEDVPDVETHTGQKYDIDDPRRLRFMNSTKYVNPNIAQELIAQVPPIACNDRVVWCDGGDPHLGHPKVYINLDKPGNHSCGYCGLRFYKEDRHH